MTDKKSGFFTPRRMAGWWSVLEDILWPDKKVVEKIKRRVEGFAKAGIDTAINFGFHARFDFSNYFSSLHGYLSNVCEELHKYGIKYMDHYSCNVVERPRGREELQKLHRAHRHHVLLYHDSFAAEHAQYEGHRFRDICEVDVRDGSRGYSNIYQFELFCHNNPGFLDMHLKYLKRLMKDVPLDGIQVDDMCDYGGLATCCCPYCLERFNRNYGHTLPDFSDKSFWGDTSGSPITWGNYNNAVFRDWIRMKADSVADHVKMVKKTIGDIPLMTCCSSTGPISLNSIGLNLERLVENLDFLMLENCGINIYSVNWVRMDAEALQQKAIAAKMGDAPTIALSYSIYDAGAYLGWCLSRFWGTANWSNTLEGRLESDPDDFREIQDLIAPIISYERKNSDLNHKDGKDVAEVRLVSNRFCRDNGWRDENGREHWNRICSWSDLCIKNNISYRFILADELMDAEALTREHTPLILDGVACVSDIQYRAVREYVSSGGVIWLRLPFGTHDEKGFERPYPLSDELIKTGNAGIILMNKELDDKLIQSLILSEMIAPVIRQISGDKCWSCRLRIHSEGAVLHILNRELVAIPHDTLKDTFNNPILYGIDSNNENERLEYIIDFKDICKPWNAAQITSPEIGDAKRNVKLEKLNETCLKVSVDVTDIKIYGVIQPG